jgi:cell division ATPase FtsA
MNTPPAVALEIGTDKVTALVGELQDNGNILITAKGEHSLTGSESVEAPNVSHLQQVLAAAEEQAQVAISRVHLVMSCENIQRLVARGIVPVLTSITDPEIQKSIDLVDSVPSFVEDIVFSGYCSALAVTTPEQRAKGVLVIEIGRGMITFAAYVAGQLAAIDACSVIGKVDAAAIQCVFNAIKRAVGIKQLAAGVLLTGEGAKTQGLPQLVGSIMGMECAVGQPLGFTGLDTVLNRPDYASCLGIIRYSLPFGPRPLSRPSSLVESIKDLFRL